MADIEGARNVTSQPAFDSFENVCRDPGFAHTRLYALAFKEGLRGSQLQDPRLVWQKWAEEMDDNEVKWRREAGESTKRYPVFRKDNSITLLFEQQSDGTWRVGKVSIAGL